MIRSLVDLVRKDDIPAPEPSWVSTLNLNPQPLTRAELLERIERVKQRLLDDKR